MRHVILVTPGKLLGHDLHLKILYRILRNKGFTVLPFSLINLFKYHKIAIWHIHWIDIFHMGTYHNLGIYKSNPIISLLRILFFFYIVLFVKILSVKMIWSIHNVTSHEYGGSIFERVVTVCLLRFSDRVTVYNNYIRTTIKKIYNFDNMFLMRQGIYEGCYQERIGKEKARKILRVPKNSFVLLLFGALLPYKGVDILIDALSNYRDNDVFVMIAGSTKNNPKYGKLIKNMAKYDDRIKIFDRHIEESEVPIFFGAADYTICPYTKISNSGILFLSITFGVPAIISDKGGVREVTSLVPDTNILIKKLSTKTIIKSIIEAKNINAKKNMEELQELLSWSNFENNITKAFQFNY